MEKEENLYRDNTSDTVLMANIINDIKKEAGHLKNPPLFKDNKRNESKTNLLIRLKGIIRKFDVRTQRVGCYGNGIRPIIKKIYIKFIKRS